MPKRNAKGRFVKSGGGGTRGKRSRSGGGALVIREQIAVSAPRSRSVARRAPAHKPKAKHHRRRHHHGGVTPMKIGISALVLGSAAETNNGPLGPTLYNVVQKLPGTKTFGGAVTTGLYAGGIGLAFGKRLGRLGPWCKAAGVVGLVGGLLRIGAQGTKFQWLGGNGATDPYMHVR